MVELIITNGDSAAHLLSAAGMKADIISWRDVLHEGPLPEMAENDGDDLEQLSTVRASFLAKAFDTPLDKVIQSTKDRDGMLRGHGSYDEVTLWFEHDLYDQLQLLQILSFFHHEKRSNALQLVQADEYLGKQTAETIGRFEAIKAGVSEEQTALAAALFQAFRKPTPSDLFAFLVCDLSPLPLMRQAILRLFEELPSTQNGLSRTQHQALALIDSDGLVPRKLFGAVQATEEAMFMGDLSFFRCLEDLVFNKAPLIQNLPGRFSAAAAKEGRQHYLDAAISLTDVGRDVLSGDADHASINDIDRWLGGTHISGGKIWRWDRDAAELVPPAP